MSIAALFHDETVFDKMSNLMPNLSFASNDIRVDLKSFLFDSPFRSILPGNLFHHSSEACQSLLEQFLCAKSKECLLDVYRKVCEVLPAATEVSKEKKILKVNTDTIKNQIKNGYKLEKKYSRI